MKIKNRNIECVWEKTAYAIVDANLVYVEIKVTYFQIHNESVYYRIVLPNGQERFYSGNFYKSPKDFENGVTIEGHKQSIREMLRGCNAYIEVDGEYLYVYKWVFEDGEPRMKPAFVEGVKFEVGVGYTALDCGKEVFFPYRDRTECLELNDYSVIDENNVHHVVRGRLKRLLPTEGQLMLIEGIKAAVNTAKAAGVRIVWDSDGEEFHFINSNEIEWSQGNDCQTYDDGFYVAGSELGSPLFKSFSIHDYWMNCDYGVDMKFKES